MGSSRDTPTWSMGFSTLGSRGACSASRKSREAGFSQKLANRWRIESHANAGEQISLLKSLAEVLDHALFLPLL